MLDRSHITQFRRAAVFAGGLLLLSSAPAVAADPAGAVAAAKGAEAQAGRTTAHEDFQVRRLEAQKRRLPASPQQALEVSEKELTAVIERVVDGHAIVSSPYDPRLEESMKKFGWQQVDAREKAIDLALFGGRMFRMIRIEGRDWRPYEAAVGRESVLTLRVTSAGGQSIAAVRPVR